jgi:lambda repressor-like predicted transcriptional regulator
MTLACDRNGELMSSTDIPQAWAVLMERRGIAPSYRALAAKTGLSHEAARRVVRGWSVKRSSAQAVADALGVDIEEVFRLRGEVAPLEPWEPPATSALLTHEERETLSRLVALLTAGRKESDGDDTDAASMKDPTVSFEPIEPVRRRAPRGGHPPTP